MTSHQTTHWSVPFDQKFVIDLFRVESDRYNRKVGILTAILFGGFTAACAWAFAWSLDGNRTLSDGTGAPQFALYLAVFGALAALGLFIAVRPDKATAFRNRALVRKMLDGTTKGTASFELCDEGISCDLSGTSLNIPYMTFTSVRVVDGTPWLTTSARKNSSLAYNLVGINWALRDAASPAIPLTMDVLAHRPALADDVMRLGREQRRAVERKDASTIERVNTFIGE